LGQGAGLVKRLSKDTRFTDVQGMLDEKGNIRAIIGQYRPSAVVAPVEVTT
jgi:hypothetical protein